jgi:DNA-binding response OmpR family regulator
MTDHAQILLVDDTPELLILVDAALRAEGFTVATTASGEDALLHMHADEPDVVILDVVLPGIDGIETCRELRTFSDAYVLMLTGRGDEPDRVAGLNVGADDYLTKPFAPSELVARVRAMLRRPRRTAAVVRDFGDLRIDTGSREVSVRGTLLDLTRIEYDLLDTLSASPHTVVSRTQLLERVWGAEWDGNDHVVDVHISNLRRKLGDDQRPSRWIHTVRGVGFRFER